MTYGITVTGPGGMARSCLCTGLNVYGFDVYGFDGAPGPVARPAAAWSESMLSGGDGPVPLPPPDGAPEVERRGQGYGVQGYGVHGPGAPVSGGSAIAEVVRAPYRPAIGIAPGGIAPGGTDDAAVARVRAGPAGLALPEDPR